MLGGMSGSSPFCGLESTLTLHALIQPQEKWVCQHWQWCPWCWGGWWHLQGSTGTQATWGPWRAAFWGYRAGDLPLCGSQSLQPSTPQMILCNITAPFQSSAHKPPSSPGTTGNTVFKLAERHQGLGIIVYRDISKVAFHFSTLVKPTWFLTGKRWG